MQKLKAKLKIKIKIVFGLDRLYLIGPWTLINH